VAGYSGIIHFASAVRKALTLKGYLNSIYGSESPFKTSWIQRSPNWHIKQEVK
jgi:hypothetical protein